MLASQRFLIYFRGSAIELLEADVERANQVQYNVDKLGKFIMAVETFL